MVIDQNVIAGVVAGGLTAFFTSFPAWFQLRKNSKQFRPNNGSSMVDKIDKGNRRILKQNKVLNASARAVVEQNRVLNFLVADNAMIKRHLNIGQGDSLPPPLPMAPIPPEELLPTEDENLVYTEMDKAGDSNLPIK